MSDWHKNSTIRDTLARARATVHGGRRNSLRAKASLKEPSRPFTPLVGRDSRVFTTTDEELKRDYPVFYTEGTLTSASTRLDSGRKGGNDAASAVTGRISSRPSSRTSSRPSSRTSSRPSSRTSSRPSSGKMTGSRPSSSRPVTARTRAENAKRFVELYSSFSSGLKELKEKKTKSTVTPADLCDLGAQLLAKASRGTESLQACQAVLKLPIKYSGREESKYHKLMYKCLKRQFEHSIRQDFDEMCRKYTLIPLALKQLKKILKQPDLAPASHISFILGAFRNLSQKEDNQRLMVRCDAIPTLASMLHQTNFSTLKLPSRNSEIKLIKEITTILRNLALIRSHNQDFVHHAVVSLLGDLLIRYSESEHVVFGVCRILAKLTFFPACRSQLSSNSKHLEAVYRILDVHRGNVVLGIRACFIMGNLTVSNDRNRMTICKDYDSKCPLLLRTLEDIIAQDERAEQKIKEEAKSNTISDENKAASGEVENLLTKVVRLLANVSINEKIGLRLCKDPKIGHLVTLLERKDPNISEEVVLNHPDAVLRSLEIGERLLGCLMPLLFSTNTEMLHEAVRVLGNFSRNQEFRKLMSSCRVDETMSVLLDHADHDIIFATAGVVLNISTDYDARQVLYANGCEGLAKIVESLYRFGKNRPEIAVIICKILVNLSVTKPAPPTGEHGGEGENKSSAAAAESGHRAAISDVWLPSNLSKQVEIWCEERLESDAGAVQDKANLSPLDAELNDLCVNLLEMLDKVSLESEESLPIVELAP
eukprot:jgi/Bigna1/90265/estExt_fgenesh1_pg.C_660062